jgi:hypothetical protein
VTLAGGKKMKDSTEQGGTTETPVEVNAIVIPLDEVITKVREKYPTAIAVSTYGGGQKITGSPVLSASPRGLPGYASGDEE